jgi:hypothetical protein
MHRGQIATGAVQNPTTDPDDVAGVLGQGDELGGSQPSAQRVIPPNKRFETLQVA